MKPATPLPWELDYIGDSGLRQVYVIRPGVADNALDGDAQYIVHACNAYPRLVAVLQLMLDPNLHGMAHESRRLLRELGELE